MFELNDRLLNFGLKGIIPFVVLILPKIGQNESRTPLTAPAPSYCVERKKFLRPRP